MDKERIMFDSNSFDKMHTSGELVKIAASERYEYYITSIQIEEIGNMPDEKKEKRESIGIVLFKSASSAYSSSSRLCKSGPMFARW